MLVGGPEAPDRTAIVRPVAAPTPIARRARRAGARALALAGGVALQASNRLGADDEGLQGDRIVEWSFCLARLADGPGTTLDFGADIAFLSLAAAQRGHDVVALDRLPSALDYHHDRVEFVQADILDRPLAGRAFDQIVNCSSIEHVGLSGRYGSEEAADGDLEAMAVLRDLLAPAGRMILTIPVGRDLVCAPKHRIYGAERLPRLLEGFRVAEEQFWRKDAGEGVWKRTDREIALETEGSAWFYSLGLFVVARP
jgi:SAM-dependent methyltransferase